MGDPDAGDNSFSRALFLESGLKGASSFALLLDLEFDLELDLELDEVDFELELDFFESDFVDLPEGLLSFFDFDSVSLDVLTSDFFSTLTSFFSLLGPLRLGSRLLLGSLLSGFSSTCTSIIYATKITFNKRFA